MVGAMDSVTLIDDFSGGLNNVDLIGTLQDNEVTAAENFDITSTGRLTSRPPFTAQGQAPVAGALTLLGFFQDDAGTHFEVYSSVAAVRTWLKNTVTNAWTQIAAWAASDCTQYGGRLYLVRTGGAGAKWMRSPTNVDPYTLVAIPAMPAGERLVGHKGRLWVATGNTVYYSAVTNISGGTTVDTFDGSFINVVPGDDGQRIVEIATDGDDLLIIRTGSTFLFSYGDDLALGNVKEIDGDIGADSWRCVARYEDSHIVLNGAKLYRLTSRVYYPLHSDRKIALRSDGTFPGSTFDAAVSVFGERALVWAGGTMYVLHLSTSSWTTYSSPTTRFAHGYEHPAGVELFGASTIVGVSASPNATMQRNSYRGVDRITVVDAEEFTCRVRTKAYDWKEPTQWKRLYSWGLDVVSKMPIVGRAIPLALVSTIVSWDDMNLVTWDELNDGTWDYPLVVPNLIEGIRDIPGIAPVQVYVRMPQPLWFRQVAFEAVLETDGTTSTAPCRIESVATIVGVKNRAPAAVN